MPSLRDLMMENEQQKLGREMSYQPFSSPIPRGVVDYAREVGGRISNPANTLRGVIDRMKEQPADEMAMDWANPIAGGLVGMFAGKGAKTANLAMLAKAEKLAKKGVPDPQIWKETGWTLNTPDKMPRFEISDDMAEYVGLSRKSPKTVESAIEHQNLYEGYPLSRKLRLVETKTPNEGSYTEAFGLEVGTGNRKSTALHELQHAIQQREGFARGGSPEALGIEEAKAAIPSLRQSFRDAKVAYDDAIDMGYPQEQVAQRLNVLKQIENDLTENLAITELGDPYKAYQRLAGEAEARLTQARMAMTPEQRLAQYPYDPEYFQQATGVPLSDLIVRKEGGNAMSLPYQIEHKPMTVSGGASQLHDLTSSFGEDIYGRNALEYFGSGDDREKFVLNMLRKVRGNPDAKVTIYRGVPADAGGINSGDWVTLHPDVAKDYADLLKEQGTKGKIVKMEVPASSITSWPDSLLEFGYYPK